uniref:MADF domain-containing protein n=1 Tax=Timema douglasi TaxID=61478 RepID=A0A7R8VQR8_TIMDO|nr:unnamed protein product [Timema douglasi]
MARRWSDDTVMNFVNLYGSESVLWDSTSVDYRNKTLRNEAVNRIVSEMGLHDFGVKECKLKIKNIRSQYWHEVGKIRSSTASGCSGDSVYKPSISLVFVALLNILVHGAALPVGVSPFQETLKSEGTVHRPLVYAYPKYSAYSYYPIAYWV